MRVIDVHTHAYPADCFDDVATWAHARQELYWLSLVQPEGKAGIQSFADADTMLRHMDAAGVDQAVLLGWYWQNWESCLWHNGYYRELVAAHPDRLMAFASWMPTGDERGLGELRRCLDAGFKGVGELMPQVQDFALTDGDWAGVVSLLQEYGASMHFHVTEPAGGAYPGRVDTPLQDYLDFAQRFPEQKIILGHLGGLLPLYAWNPQVAQGLANVYYDTAACPLLYRPEVLQAVADVVGLDKILWGSDYPLRSFPKLKLPQQWPAYQSWLQEGLGAEAALAVWQGNAGSFFIAP